MSSFADRFGKLKVQDIIELNKAAKWYCEHEVISNSEEVKNVQEKEAQ